MTKEKFSEIVNGFIELLDEVQKSPNYDKLETSIMNDLGILMNRIDCGLFIHLHKCLFEKDDE